MDKYYLDVGKQIIDKEDIIEFKKLVDNYVTYIKDKEYHYNFSLFKDLFIHACLRGKLEIVKELYYHYLTFNDIDKIGLKPTFKYCKYMTKDKGVKEFLKCF